MKPILKQIPKKSLHEKVADTLRSTLLHHFSPGQKLDPEARLAEQLNVSVLTLRQGLSVLAYEGLIERHHGRGTYVANHQKQKTVAVGAVSCPGEQQPSLFQTRLFFSLTELFRRKGYRCRSYVAPYRTPEGWRELAEDVEHGRIAGAAFVAMNPESIPVPFAEHGVPYVDIGGGDMPSVELDRNGLVRDGIRHLLERGCRRIALMQYNGSAADTPRGQPWYEIFRSTMAEYSVAVREEWNRWAVPNDVPGAGWEQFREIWAARDEKPDGLLVTDDVLFRDVALAILDSRINVPQQLQVVVHANKGSGLTYPFPVNLLEVDVNEWAELIAETLIKLMNKETVSPRVRQIRARLIPAEANPDEHTLGITSSVKTDRVVGK